MNYEKIIRHCLALRLAFEQDEARFFVGLYDIERRHMGELRKNGCDDFASFIRSHELCRPERYRRFAAGMRHTTPDEAVRLGAPAVMALSRIHDKRNVVPFKEAIEAWKADKGGVLPTQETASRILRQVDPRPETPRAVIQISQAARIREEANGIAREAQSVRREAAKLKRDLGKAQKKAESADEFRAENRRLKKENGELRKEIARLKGVLRAAAAE